MTDTEETVQQSEEKGGARYDPDKPHVWVYDPHQLHGGLDFPEVSMKLTYPNELNERAGKLFGRVYDSPFLGTKGGLENPVLIYIDGQTRPFISGTKTAPVDAEKRFDRFEYHQLRDKLFGDKSIPEAAQGRNFEVVALNRYPTPEDKLWWQAHDETSVIFDPSADTDVLREPIQDIYGRLVNHYPDLSDVRPSVLGWYISDGQFRIASRPYKTTGAKQIAIATTLPVELIAD